MGGPTWLVGIIGAIILVVVVLGVQAVLKATVTTTADELVVEADLTELTAMHARDASRLVASPRVVEYVDENGTVTTRLAIPLEDAIKATLVDLKKANTDQTGLKSGETRPAIASAPPQPGD